MVDFIQLGKSAGAQLAAADPGAELATNMSGWPNDAKLAWLAGLFAAVHDAGKAVDRVSSGQPNMNVFAILADETGVTLIHDPDMWPNDNIRIRLG